MLFGLIIIGDEILSGRRQDRHLPYFKSLLAKQGHGLHWVQILPDEPELLTERLRASMGRDEAVFCCGGIGSTPDDHTRACAAAAADRPLERHAQAAAWIEQRFGEQAYPYRIRMADLPRGAELIPNPINQIPGFSIQQHYFLPGFPDMAHPMAAWVLEQYYPQDRPLFEAALKVHHPTENDLLPIMEALSQAYPQLKLFSLPRLQQWVELGFKGEEKRVKQAMQELQQALKQAGFNWSI